MHNNNRQAGSRLPAADRHMSRKTTFCHCKRVCVDECINSSLVLSELPPILYTCIDIIIWGEKNDLFVASLSRCRGRPNRTDLFLQTLILTGNWM